MDIALSHNRCRLLDFLPNYCGLVSLRFNYLLSSTGQSLGSSTKSLTCYAPIARSIHGSRFNVCCSDCWQYTSRRTDRQLGITKNIGRQTTCSAGHILSCPVLGCIQQFFNLPSHTIFGHFVAHDRKWVNLGGQRISIDICIVSSCRKVSILHYYYITHPSIHPSSPSRVEE